MRTLFALLLSLPLLACGTGAPGGGGTGLATQGLVVKSAGAVIGTLLDVDDNYGTLKVYLDNVGAAIYVNERTGFVAGGFGATGFMAAGCTGTPAVEFGNNLCVLSSAQLPAGTVMPPRVRAVGGDRYGLTRPTKVLLGAGALLDAPVFYGFGPTGLCVDQGRSCVQAATEGQVPTGFATPITVEESE